VTTQSVSALEYAALLELDKLVRLAMVRPGAAEALVVCLQSLDAIRREEGLAASPVFSAPEPAHDQAEVSALAAGLIRRAMQP
jgi:hypothetical protein